MTVIPIVQGNLLRLGIPLRVVKITSVEGVVDKQVDAFVPNPNFPVRVLLTRDSIVCEFTATMEGNVAVIEDKGTVLVGKYALTVLCRDDDGNPMRFKQKDAVNIVDLTAEAGIVPGAEFETGTQWLDGAVFLSLNAQGGGGIGEESDPTVPQHVKAITQGNIDAWNAKQEAIGDLGQIRAGAAAGATALQPGALNGYATSDAVNRAIARIQAAIDTMMGADDVTDAIDTFNEIVAFLDSVEDTETLAGIIAGLNTAIAAKYTKPDAGIPATDLAQAVRDLLALAGTAVQPSALNGYVTTSTLEGYYTKSEVNNLIPDISGKADKNDLVSMPIVDASAMANETTYGSGLLAENLVSASQSITIDAGKYYDFGERPLSGESGLAIFPKEQCEDGSNAYSYVGRFTIDDSFSGTFQFAMISARKNSNKNVLEGDTTGDFSFTLPDDVKFTAGHTYEFNILYDTCFIKDITAGGGE